MKYFVILFGFLILIGCTIAIPYAYADCNINTDWPDAPCMDEIVNNSFPQYQVDKWAEFSKYKGAEFMESKRLEMNGAIESDRLLDWIEKSTQNSNVWHYYYFAKMAPNPYPHLQGIGFTPIQHVNYVDFRNAEGEIICKGYSGSGGFFEYPECGPPDQFVRNVLIVVLPIAGFVIGFVVWRKRK